MRELDDLLGLEDSPSQRRANTLVENDMSMLRGLCELRVALGLSQADVAKRLGVSQPAIAAFERYDNDPKLSTIRRYAHAISALIEHHVTLDGPRRMGTSNGSQYTLVHGHDLSVLVARGSNPSASDLHRVEARGRTFTLKRGRTIAQ